MSAWTEAAVRELEVELNRLDLDTEAKRAGLERAQAEYDAAIAEQATVRGMPDWARRKQARQAAEEPAVAASMHQFSTVLATESTPLAQTELCMRVLTQFGRDTQTVEVRKSLNQAGYDFTQAQVRAALKYLARKKNPPIKSVRPGVWRLTGAPFPAGSAAVPAANGAGGSP